MSEHGQEPRPGEPAFFTVGTYYFPQNALLAQNALEGRGIKSYVLGEHTAAAAVHITIMPNPTRGGIRLQVAAEDAEQALAVLEAEGVDEASFEAHANAVSPPDEETFEDDGDDGDGGVSEEEIEQACPLCESDRIVSDPRPQALEYAGLGLIVSMVLLDLPYVAAGIFVVLFLRYWVMHRFRCVECGHRWSQSTRRDEFKDWD